MIASHDPNQLYNGNCFGIPSQSGQAPFSANRGKGSRIDMGFQDFTVRE